MKTQVQYVQEFEKKVRDIFNSSTLFKDCEITFTYKKKRKRLRDILKNKKKGNK